MSHLTLWMKSLHVSISTELDHSLAEVSRDAFEPCDNFALVLFTAGTDHRQARDLTEDLQKAQRSARRSIINAPVRPDSSMFAADRKRPDVADARPSADSSDQTGLSERYNFAV